MFRQVKVVQKLAAALALIADGSVEALVQAMDLEDVQMGGSQSPERSPSPPPAAGAVQVTLRARVKKLGITDKKSVNQPRGMQALALTEQIMGMCDDDGVSW